LFTEEERDDYSFRDLLAGSADLDPYKELFKRNAAARRPGVLEWKYNENPSPAGGTALIAEATQVQDDWDDAYGALYAAMGVDFWINGQVVPASQSLDTLTDTNHRRKGLFVDLAKAAYARLQKKQVAMVYGFPNGNSHHGFRTKLAWDFLDPVPFKIRPLRTGYALKRLKLPLKGLDFSWPVLGKLNSNNIILHDCTAFGEEHDALWADIKKTIGVCIDRSATYLNWRLFENPAHQKYKVLSAKRNGALVAEVIWCTEEKHGGLIGYIMDCFHRQEDDEIGALLIRNALKQMQAEGADVALAWNDAEFYNYESFKATGFLPFPVKLQPIELHWGFICLDETIRQKLNNRRAWYLSYLDSDTV
jgi:hypothetical protein